MKIFGLLLLGISLLGLLAYIVMAVLSQKEPDNLGMLDGVLRPCPDSPNCVCSEKHTADNQQHYIEPMAADIAAWKRLPALLKQQGAHIEQQHDDYIHATFSTAIFRYVDDVEFRFDATEGLIYMRSASRIGRSDFGVNRQRMIVLQQAFTANKP